MAGRRRRFRCRWRSVTNTAARSSRSAVKFPGFKAGDRVSGEGHITCGHCRNCRAGRRHLCRNTVGVGVNRPGCFAEYVVIPALNAFKLPDAIDDEIAAILDPLGNAVHTALAFDVVGEDVLITGAGPIGIMAAAIVRFVGARHVVDHRRERLPARTRTQDGRNARAQRHARLARRCDETTRHAGRLRCRTGDVRQCGCISRLLRTMHHGGSVALLGFPRTKWRSTGTK